MEESPPPLKSTHPKKTTRRSRRGHGGKYQRLTNKDDDKKSRPGSKRSLSSDDKGKYTHGDLMNRPRIMMDDMDLAIASSSSSSDPATDTNCSKRTKVNERTNTTNAGSIDCQPTTMARSVSEDTAGIITRLVSNITSSSSNNNDDGMDSEEENELGAFIYKSSLTAKSKKGAVQGRRASSTDARRLSISRAEESNPLERLRNMNRRPHSSPTLSDDMTMATEQCDGWGKHSMQDTVRHNTKIPQKKKRVSSIASIRRTSLRHRSTKAGAKGGVTATSTANSEYDSPQRHRRHFKRKRISTDHFIACPSKSGVGVKDASTASSEHDPAQQHRRHSKRKRIATDHFIARPSRSGVGVKDGDHQFLTGLAEYSTTDTPAATTKPDHEFTAADAGHGGAKKQKPQPKHKQSKRSPYRKFNTTTAKLRTVLIKKLATKYMKQKNSQRVTVKKRYTQSDKTVWNWNDALSKANEEGGNVGIELNIVRRDVYIVARGMKQASRGKVGEMD